MDSTTELKELLRLANEELKQSPLYLKVKELEELLIQSKTSKYDKWLEYIKEVLQTEGYECRSDYEINVVDGAFVGHLPCYNYLIVKQGTPTITKIILDDNDFNIVFEDGNTKSYDDGMFGGVGVTELDAYEDTWYYFNNENKKD